MAFVVDPSRSRQVALDVLGKSYPGIVVCDGLPTYDIFETARCNGHPLAADVDGRRAGLMDVRELLKSGLALRDRRKELTDLGFQRKVTTLRSDLDDWIERHRNTPDEEVSRLAGHLEKYESEFLRYLKRSPDSGDEQHGRTDSSLRGPASQGVLRQPQRNGGADVRSPQQCVGHVLPLPRRLSRLGFDPDASQPGGS